MVDVIEDFRNEFKVKITDKLETEVISFLNTMGGNIFIGVNDKGEIVGLKGDIDEIQRNIKDRLNDNISPSIIGLYDVVVEEYENKRYIKIVVAKGNERPYYLKGMGMTPESCFVRIGSAIQGMTREMINYEFNKRHRNSIVKIVSPKQDLTFNQLKIYYEEKGYPINKNFYQQLQLYTEDGEFNLLAFILADNNDISVRFGKYEGEDVSNMVELEEYGYCSIIKATNRILDKLKIENKTFTKITYPLRKEIKMYNYEAVREAVINAMCHNDWAREDGPQFEIYSDRLVVSSHGGLQEGVNSDDFVKGYSLPKNKELMKVFKDLEFVEHMGTGIKKILKSYPSNIFDFYPNFITVTFKFNENTFEKEREESDLVDNEETELNETQKMMIKLIRGNPNITQIDLARKLDVAERTVRRNLKELMDMGIITRFGARKNGEWKILKM